jgi:hypothetical protein
MNATEYELDGDNRIYQVGEGWDAFAAENDGAELISPGVEGRSLWDFVSGREVRIVLEQLFERVRTSDTPVSLPFRCDAPSLRRFLTMHIVPLDVGHLLVTNRLLKEEKREALSIMDRRSPRGSEQLRMCSWCNRFAVPPWLFVEEAVRWLDLFSLPRIPRITHGICPICEAALLGSLDASRGAQRLEEWIRAG